MAPITLAGVTDFVAVMLDTEKALAKQPGVNTLELALLVARQCMKAEAIKGLEAAVHDEIQMLYDMHVAAHGELVEGAKLFQIETWVAPLEANWLEFIDTYNGVLSAHWLGTADTKTPRSQKEVDGVCNSFAQEVWRNLSYVHDRELPREKTDVEILSEIGITPDHIDTLIRNRKIDPATVTEEVTTMIKYDLKAAIELLHSNATMMGLTGSNLYDVIDNASDGDAGLAASGLTQLGMPTDANTQWVMRDIKEKYGVEHFAVMVETGNYAPRQDQPPATPQGFAQPQGFTPAPAVVYEYANTNDGKAIRREPGGQWEFYEPAAAPAPVAVAPAPPAPAPLPPPAVPVAQYEFATAGDGKAIRRLQNGGQWEYVPEAPAVAPAAPATPPKTPAPPATDAGAIPAAALKAIKDFTSLKGEDLGGGLGVSRATFDNYTKGKGAKCAASEGNKAFLLKHVDEHIAALQYARNAIASA